MRVLHYIDAFHPICLSKEYFEILAQGMKDGDDMHILMPKQDEEVKVEGVTVHYASYFRWMKHRNKRKFLQIMDELNPDILHIHACWSRQVADILHWNDIYYKRPYILSPHKLLLPWHQQNKVKRWLQAKFYQEKIISEADAIITDSDQENNIQANRHSITIPNAIYAHGYEERQMQEQYITLLRKLSYSRPYLFMDGKERRKEAELLRYAVTHPRHNSDDIFTIDDDESETYKRIALHAINEGTISIMRPFLPQSVIDMAENAPRFIYNTKKNTDSLYSLRTLANKSDIASIASEEKATDDEKQVVKQIVNVIYEIANNSLSQRHLIELYKTLRYNYYNEDILNTMLNRLGKFKDAARLMQLLKDYYDLEEGYMPMQPLDDQYTKHIKRKLLLWQIQG